MKINGEISNPRRIACNWTLSRTVQRRGPWYAPGQYLGNTEPLTDKSGRFLEHRAVPVGLEIGLPAFHGASKDSGSDELLQFPLDGA